MTHPDPRSDVHRSTSTRTRPRAAESTSTVPGRLVGKVVYLGPGPRLSRVEVHLGTDAGAPRQTRACPAGRAHRGPPGGRRAPGAGPRPGDADPRCRYRRAPRPRVGPRPVRGADGRHTRPERSMTARSAPCPALRRARLVPVSAGAPVPGADRSPRLRNTRKTGFCGYCGDAEEAARRILPGAVRPAEPLTSGRPGGADSGERDSSAPPQNPQKSFLRILRRCGEGVPSVSGAAAALVRDGR